MATSSAHKAPRRAFGYPAVRQKLAQTLAVGLLAGAVLPRAALADDGPTGKPGHVAASAVSPVAALARLGDPLEADPVRTERRERRQVGTVWVSELGTARVRSNRAAGPRLAYVPPAYHPDREHFAALAEFESRVLPETAARQPAQTIRTEPPEAWMKKLELPDLPVRWNRELVAYLDYFKNDPNGQAMMKAWFRRKGRYEPEIRRILAEVGAPEDLIFVALAESGFHPGVRSRVGAAGMWQFMEPTGRVYGLGSDYWVDDRRDFQRSTFAAASYLEDLRVRFGSWELALAAYNAGYGLVMQAIRRHNTNNYWALCEIESGLPHSTTRYVPKIVAAAIVGRNPEVFGLADLDGVLPADTLVEVEVPPGTRIEDLAKAIDVDEDLLDEYNARYIRGRTPPDGGPSRVRIPKAALSRFERADPELKAALQPYTTYELPWGEDLETVAMRFGITERHLRSLNGVRDSAEVEGGVTLVVPKSPSTEPEGAAHTGEQPPPPLVAVPPLSVPGDRRMVFVRVTRAVTQRELTERLGVGWSELLGWNDLDPSARLFDGMWLQVLVPRDYDGRAKGIRVHELDEVVHVIRGTRPHLEAELDRRGMVRRAHKVKKGETLARIGKKYDLSIGSIARINGFERSHRPEPGDLVIIYVDAGQTRGTVSAPPPPSTAITRELAEVEQVTQGSRDPSTADTARLPGSKP